MNNRHYLYPYINEINRPGLAHVPGALNKPEDLELAARGIEAQLKALIGTEPIDNKKADKLADLYIGLLPVELSKGLKEDMEAFKSHLSATLMNLVGVSTDGTNKVNISQEDIKLAVASIEVELLLHNANAIKLRAEIHDKNRQAPDKVVKHFMHSGAPKSLTLERAGTYILLTASAWSSQLGGAHLAGEAIEKLRKDVPFFEQLEWLKDPSNQNLISESFGAITAGAVTFWALRKFKHELTEIAFKDNRSLPSSAAQAIKNRWSGTMESKALCAVFIAALGYDLYSNADGAVTLTAGAFDDAEQLKGAKETIDAAKAEVQSKLKDLPEHIRDQEAAFGTKLVQEEFDGKGYGGVKKDGPMYYGKMALLTDEASGLHELSIRPGVIAQEVNTSVHGSGLIEDQQPGIGPDFYKVTKSVTDQVASHLTAIDGLEGTLSSEAGTAANSARIEQIKAEFKDILSLVGPNGELTSDLDTTLAKYNNALAALGEIAKAHPEIYTGEGVPMDKVTPPTVNVNIENIGVIKTVNFKSSVELIKQHLDKGEMGDALLVLSGSLAAAIFMSYGNDIVFGRKIRKTHVEDRQKIEEEKEEFANPMLDSLVTTFDVLCNGMYMKTGKTEPIHPKAIKEVILAYCKEQKDAGKPRDIKGKLKESTFLNDAWRYAHKRIFKGPKLGKHNVAANTEEVNEFNDELKVLAEILNGHEGINHLRAILMRLLPNLNALKEKDGKNVKAVRDSNDAHLKPQNEEEEAKELAAFKEHAESLKLDPKDGFETIFQKMQTSIDLLKGLTMIRATKLPRNLEEREEIQEALLKVWEDGEKAMEASMIESIENIPLKATGDSIKEAREQIAALDSALASCAKNARHISEKTLTPFLEYGAAKVEKNGEIQEMERQVEAIKARLARTVRKHGEATKFQEESDAFRRQLSLWWNHGTLEKERPLFQANQLLTLLESDDHIGEGEAPKMVDLNREDQTFSDMRLKLSGFMLTYSAEGDLEKVSEVEEWVNRLDRAKANLDKFVTRI